MPKALLFGSCLYLPKKDKNTAQVIDNFPYKPGDVDEQIQIESQKEAQFVSF